MSRTIIVGDVHGCAYELDDLLDKLAYVKGTDRLVLVGDLVARGPDSRGVIDRVERYGAECARGNHDEKVLSWWRVMQKEGRRAAWQKVRMSDRHAGVVKSLRDRNFEYMSRTPMYIELPEHGAAVVHAGVDPDLGLHYTAPEVMFNIRSVDEFGIATRKLSGTPWATLWQGPTQLIFGHDARRQLQFERYATGLDTGCCYGRALTALVLGKGTLVPEDREARKAMTVSVPARKVWCPMGDGEGPE